MILCWIGTIKPHVFGEAVDLVVAIATDCTVGRTAPSTLHIVHTQWTCSLAFLRETDWLVTAATEITGHLGVRHTRCLLDAHYVSLRLLFFTMIDYHTTTQPEPLFDTNSRIIDVIFPHMTRYHHS